MNLGIREEFWKAVADLKCEYGRISNESLEALSLRSGQVLYSFLPKVFLYFIVM